MISKNVYYLLLFLVFILCVPLLKNGFSNSKIFHKDSLTIESSSKAPEIISKIPRELTKGIVASNYKKSNLIEFIPLTAKEVPRILLPPINFRPRLITTNQIIRGRKNIFREPNQLWYRLIKAGVERYINQPNLILNSLILNQAEDIKNLAFIYKVENDRRYLDAAVELVKQIPEPPNIINFEGGRSNQGWGDFVQSGQALPALCVALDLLWNDMDSFLRWDTRRKFLKIAEQLLEASLYTPANNHVVVFATAILTNTILEDHPEEFISYKRQEMWQGGLDALSRGLGLAIPDGGYGEGVYYANFILRYLAPLSVYFQNATGLKLFEHPYLERMINWVNANDKGTGSYSGFDDAFQNDFFILPVIIHQSRLKKNWYAHWNSQPQPMNAQNNMAEAICVFESLPFKPTSTESPVQFFPETGQVIFRDQTLNPQIFGSFISEREKWFASRHEHIDPFHFEVSAFGEDVIVDGGYGAGTGDVNRRWFISAQAHNGILVDGLGTYLNPIWGDPIESEFKHAFQTEQAASVTMTHSIGDVDLKRKIFFLQNDFFLLYDEYEGNESHTVSLNFNHLGNLEQPNQYQIRLRRNQSNLNIYFLSSTSAKPTVTQNFGLFTPPGLPKPSSTFQIENPKSRKGFFLTLICPEENGHQRLRITKHSVKGEGELLKIGSSIDLNTETEIGINRGFNLETPRWRSDAKMIVVIYNSSLQICGLLLINFTNFQSNEFELQTDFPINLFLERDEFFWQGYIDIPDESLQYTLSLKGIPEFPFRFNRIPVKPFYKSENVVILSLRGSGPIDIGSGFTPVKVPYRYHPPPDLIQWMSQQPNPNTQYEFWSDYHRSAFNNQIVENLQSGFEQAVKHWNNQLFPGTEIIHRSYYAISGVSQESYSSQSRSTYSIQLPHRYQYVHNIKNLRVSFFEEGTFSIDKFRLRNFKLDLQNNDGMGIVYRAGSWFNEHQMHQLRLYSSGGNQVFYQLAEHDQNLSQQIQLNLENERMALNPGYVWSNNENNDLFLNWSITEYSGNFRRIQQNGQNQYHESLAGFGNQWAFSVEGKQIESTDFNQQEYTADWFYNFLNNLSISQGLYLTKTQDWEIPLAFSEVNWRSRNLSLAGKVQRQDEILYQQFSGNYFLKKHQLSASINLTDFDFEKESSFRFRWNFRNDKGIRLYNNLLYRYSTEQNKFFTEVFHTFSIPLSSNHFWQPIFGEIFPFKDPFQWIGSGYMYNGRQSFFAQILANRFVHPVIINYQFAINFMNDNPNPLLNTWLRLEQWGEQLNGAEIQVQLSDYPMQPGILYSYLRDSGIRFEGFLQWRW